METKLHVRCPRCGGKVLIDKDYHGWYEECLQCGYTCDLQVLMDVQVTNLELEAPLK